MGICVPRPAMRAREERNLKATLAKHAAIMAQLQASGMSRDEASKQAFEIVTKRSK